MIKKVNNIINLFRIELPAEYRREFYNENCLINFRRLRFVLYSILLWVLILFISDFSLSDRWDSEPILKTYLYLDIILASIVIGSLIISRYLQADNTTNNHGKLCIFSNIISCLLVCWAGVTSGIDKHTIGNVIGYIVAIFGLSAALYSKGLVIFAIYCISLSSMLFTNYLVHYTGVDLAETDLPLLFLILMSFVVSRVLYRARIDNYIKSRRLNDSNKLLKEEIRSRIKVEDKLLSTTDKLADALQKEKELGELKARFVSSVSHEYRTPLTIIMSSTFLLEKYYEIRDIEKFNSQMEKIRLSVKSMNILMEEVLEIGRAYSGRLNTKLEEVNLINFLESLSDDLRVLDENKHRIILKNNGPAILKSDKKLLSHVFINLLSNAMKYSPDADEITISVHNNMKFVNVDIADKGIGIPEEEMDMLFEPFHRFSNVSNIKGIGLGMSIVKKYIEELHGNMQVKSKINEGTTVSISIPKNT